MSRRINHLGIAIHYADPAYLETKQEESVMVKHKSADAVLLPISLHYADPAY